MENEKRFVQIPLLKPPMYFGKKYTEKRVKTLNDAPQRFNFQLVTMNVTKGGQLQLTNFVSVGWKRSQVHVQYICN